MLSDAIAAGVTAGVVTSLGVAALKYSNDAAKHVTKRAKSHGRKSSYSKMIWG